MSIWGDLASRAMGKKLRSEDFAVIYGDGTAVHVVKEGDYEGYHYYICTNGNYPILDIRTKSRISAFSGSDTVTLKLDDVDCTLDRMMADNYIKFVYEFNKEGDYDNSNPKAGGHQYSLAALEIIAKKFIDEIIKADHDLDSYL